MVRKKSFLGASGRKKPGRAGLFRIPENWVYKAQWAEPLGAIS